MNMYPDSFPVTPSSPKKDDYSILYLDDDLTLGLVSNTMVYAGTVLATTQGEMVTDIRKHTLQITPELHQFDPYFSGYLTHSCEPNVKFDPETRNLIAIIDIEPFHIITMDYSVTESKLWQQFECKCNSNSCRKWIHGYAEAATNTSYA